MKYAIRDEYRPRFGRQVLTLWSGAFCSDYEGHATELPGHKGYMVATIWGSKARVECESPRTESNYDRVDEAINKVLAASAGATP